MMIVPPIEADADRDQRHLDRDARREDGARQLVPADLVGAEPVRALGPAAWRRHRGHRRIGRDDIGE
jgi:hypothetical protein